MSESPYAVYVEDGAVHVQWDSRGEFVTLHENGEVTTQLREPRGVRVTSPTGHGHWSHPRLDHFEKGA